MAKRFTDAQLKGLKSQKQRVILYEDGGRGFGLRIEPSGRKSFFLEYRFGLELNGDLGALSEEGQDPWEKSQSCKSRR